MSRAGRVMFRILSPVMRRRPTPDGDALAMAALGAIRKTLQTLDGLLDSRALRERTLPRSSAAKYSRQARGSQSSGRSLNPVATPRLTRWLVRQGEERDDRPFAPYR